MKRIDDAVQLWLERFTLSEVLGALGRWMTEGPTEELHPFGMTLKALAETPPVLRCAGALRKDEALRPEPWADLVNTGLLFEINRAVLHPFGLALRVTHYDAEEGGGVEFNGLVSLPDPEGIIFDAASLASGANKLGVFLRAGGGERLKARREALGYVVQPAGMGTDDWAAPVDKGETQTAVNGPQNGRTAPRLVRAAGRDVPVPEGWSIVYRDRVSNDDPLIVTGDVTNKPTLPSGWAAPVWVDALDWWESKYIGPGETPESNVDAHASSTSDSARPAEHERWPTDEANFDGLRFRYRRGETRSYSVTGSRVFVEFDICTQSQEGAKAVDALRRDAETGTVGWLATRCGDPEARCGWSTICQWPADTAHNGEDASFTFEIHADEQTAREASRNRHGIQHGVQQDDTAQMPAPGLHAWLRGLLDLVSGFYGPPLPAAELNAKMAALDDGLRAMEQRAKRRSDAVAADVARAAEGVARGTELSTETVKVSNMLPGEREDITAISDAIVRLAKSGVTVSQDKIHANIGLSENKPTDASAEQPLVPGTNNVHAPARWHLAPVFPGDRPAIHYFGTKAPTLDGDWSTPVSGGIAGLWVSFYTGARSGTHSGEALLQDAAQWAEHPPTPPRTDTPPSPHHAEHDHVGEVVDMDKRYGHFETNGTSGPMSKGGAALLDLAAEPALPPAPTDPPPAPHFEMPEPPASPRTRLQGTVNEQTVTFVNPHFGDGYLLANIEASPLNWRSGALVTLHIPARMTRPRECRIHPKGGFWVFTWMPEKVVSLGVATKGVKAGEMVALEYANTQVSAPKGERIVLRYGEHMVDAWLDRVTTKPNVTGTPERLYRIVVTLIDGARTLKMMDAMRAHLDQGAFTHDLSIRSVRDIDVLGPILARAVVWPGRESASRTVTFLESPNDLTSEAKRLRAWLAEREERPAPEVKTALAAPTPKPAPEPVPLMRQAPYITLADLETRVPRVVLLRCLEWGVEQKLTADLPQVQTLCEDASQQFDAMLRAHGGMVEHIPSAVVKRLVADLALLILQTRNPDALATRPMAHIDAEMTVMVKASRSAKVSGGIKGLLDLVHDERLDAQPDSSPS